MVLDVIQITSITLQLYCELFVELAPQTATSFRVYTNIMIQMVIKHNKLKVKPTIITVNAITSL